MRIEDRLAGDVLILSVKEPRLDARTAPALKERIAGLVAAGSDRIVLDLAEVEFIDSSGLGAIASAVKLLGRQGDIVIAGSREAVAALFRLTRMDKVLRLFPTVDDAQRALASRAS